jgi:predicted aspartyl protease
VLLAAAAAAPAPSGPDPAPEAVLADLPILEAPEPNRVVIDLAPPSHRPLRFLVDTGASLTYATPGAARNLGIRVRRHKSNPYRRPTVLGRDVQVVVDASSSDTAARTGWEHAFLGGDFLARYVLEIDFHRARVRFLDPELYRVPERGEAPRASVLPLQVVGNRALAELEVGENRMPFLIDTAFQGVAILSGAAAARVGVAAESEHGAEGETPLGPLRLLPATIPRLGVGWFEERNVPILIAPRGLHNQAGEGGSVVGVELLRRFVMRIDYPRARLLLFEPTPAAGGE